MRQNIAMLLREPVRTTEHRESTQGTAIDVDGTPPAEIDVSMRDMVILSLQPQLRAMAYRFARQMCLTEAVIDGLDLVQEANLVLLEVYTEALCKPNPYAYLMGAARLAMIKSASSHTRTHGLRMLSLDAPLSRESDRATCLADVIAAPFQQEAPLPHRSQSLIQQLQAAIAKLTPAQQTVILHHFYGVDGPPESLATISRRFTWSRQNVQQHKQRALANLHKHLSRCLTDGEAVS
ncbi:hypothetical protein KSD_61990 [Ktedonobacter sp. SOSP1-85]|uniref:sigma-70 family RNA polymerase sigma factor n=1 Tax=Ktedonobacter sp. SOSP1-85 TaxID=2778367 RepID=UPI0019159A01|nr:sigma-70 family RNA polymerase sigma factor [Ktedonobacter sp. SOSP1-85]GHO78428.1 hypothetical protein KSD_61990 [Ktedonobacter sp. SOSP1-85]